MTARSGGKSYENDYFKIIPLVSPMSMTFFTAVTHPYFLSKTRIDLPVLMTSDSFVPLCPFADNMPVSCNQAAGKAPTIFSIFTEMDHG